MTRIHDSKIKDVVPESVWTALKDNQNTALVDCRTTQEWAVIGIPDLGKIGKVTHLVEWKMAPDMRLNAEFADEVEKAFGGAYPEQLFFICRSGARSKEAATYIQDILSSKSIACECVNVAEGFEGTRDAPGTSGWRDKNLPVKQG